MVCPVCREPLTYDVDQLLSSPAPQLPEVLTLRTLTDRRDGDMIYLSCLKHQIIKGVCVCVFI